MILAFLAAAAAAQSAETPRQFVTRVYASYRSPDFSPFTHPTRYFAPQLVAAMKEDARLAHGEVGYLDSDPVCQCQDSTGLNADVAMLSRPSPGTAKAKIHIAFEGGDIRDFWLDLVHTGRGWRIADVNSADEPSLLAALDKANREARAEAGRK